mmetsp:Transcript_23476/g.32403  ORF Transcript_23476/g.32403 Transcript_23476/m.32403 type:complete len:172 (+) Transcript_23476:143-658(+)|eukprot:CAMPEP_0196581130 /NCGR_PEP_ID=MMETSP1081-20130531/32562_1 /TAXON_ID=36882 /ORGANISM="Pyramimonas amylifera, Strain CCMP720" /LENGTH=171 /DNA_ID=CAMNT_0041901241 /DNA_START=138 /DNA_END=653 /DNA_ORIENTATION=+
MSKYTSLQSFSEKTAQLIPMPTILPESELQLVPSDGAAAQAPPGDAASELEAKLAWITEKVPLKECQVMGTQAGAGSGDFHQYRMARRREQFRWMRIEADDHHRKEQEEWEERKRQREAEDNAKLSKHQRKRQKKKEKALEKKGYKAGPINSEEITKVEGLSSYVDEVDLD